MEETFSSFPEGSTHRITDACIIANGIRDLCIAKGAKPGDVCCRKTDKANKDEILLVPLGDILWIHIDPPYRGNTVSLALDIGDAEQDMKPLVKALLEYGKSVRRETNTICMEETTTSSQVKASR